MDEEPVSDQITADQQIRMSALHLAVTVVQANGGDINDAAEGAARFEKFLRGEYTS